MGAALAATALPAQLRAQEPDATAQLRSVALVNYGHFSTVQAQGRSVRGMDFQVQRLQRSTQALFGAELPQARIRELLRQALQGHEGLALVRINVYPTRLNWMDMKQPMPPGVLITKSPLAPPAHTPQRVRSTRYEREMPHIKHVGTFGLFHHRRQAQVLGFDDALFVNTAGSVLEGTTWNVGFHDGQRFVLPTGPALPGCAIHLLRQGMLKLGVPFVQRDVKLAELGGMRAAFLTNVPAVYQPIVQVDDIHYDFPQALHETLQACYLANPLEEV
jgi:branched-subunit amino acid aminotransferase/4-amino-4-deoxychorismate lyase